MCTSVVKKILFFNALLDILAMQNYPVDMKFFLLTEYRFGRVVNQR